MKKGILKNFVNRFRRYKNPYLSLEDRFIKPEDKSSKWTDAVISTLTSNNLKSRLKFLWLVKLNKISILEENIVFLIDKFTNSNTQKEELNQCIEEVKKVCNKEIKDINILEDGNQIEFQLHGEKDNKIKATKLTSLVKGIEKALPELLTDERDCECHKLSIILIQLLKQGEIVTGKIYTTCKKATYLHSWLEIEIENQTYCFDGEINAVMRKESFYKLYHIKPLERISYDQLNNDLPTLRKWADKEPLWSKLYLSSREEALELANQVEKEDTTENQIS